MAKKNVRSIKELEKEINKILFRALDKDDSATANVIKEVESDMVERFVHDSYQPDVYRRRGEKGGSGLEDTSNMYHMVKNNKNKVVLNVENLTPQNTEHYNPITGETYRQQNTSLKKDGDLAQLVEHGHKAGGRYYMYVKEGAAYLKPRPFQEKTVEYLRGNSDLKKSLMIDLSREGLYNFE